MYSWKISEFQAEGPGFQHFAWLGSNPSDAPDILVWKSWIQYKCKKKWLHTLIFDEEFLIFMISRFAFVFKNRSRQIGTGYLLTFFTQTNSSTIFAHFFPSNFCPQILSISILFHRFITPITLHICKTVHTSNLFV